MATSNLQIAVMVAEAADANDRAKIKRDITDRYQAASATHGIDFAESLAGVEAIQLLFTVDIDPDGEAYIRGLIAANQTPSPAQPVRSPIVESGRAAA